MLRTAEYRGRLLPDGHLSIAPEVVQQLNLRAESTVKVVLSTRLDRDGELTQASELSGDDRKRAWDRILRIREKFAGCQFSATEAVVRARQEEDETLCLLLILRLQ